MEKTTWTLPPDLVQALCDVTGDLEGIAEDQRRLCRCTNVASCMCVGSTVARVYRQRVGEAADRLRGLLGVRPRPKR